MGGPSALTIETLALSLLAVIVGSALGTVTGLLPALHVNTVAPIVLLVAAGSGALALPLVALIVSLAVVHTIVNVIPTAAAPIPDDDTALVLLPLQRLTQQGHVDAALRVSARASWIGGLAVCAGLLIVALGGRAVPRVPAEVAPAVVGLIVTMLILRSRDPGRAGALFLLAGAAGLLILDESLVGPFGGDGNILLPAFAGLFGAPLLVMTLGTPQTASPGPEPPSADPLPRPPASTSIIGTGCGLMVAAFPGLTSATAGTVGRSLRRPRHDIDDVAMLSAVDTANAVGNTAALLVWGATRSGASAAALVAFPGLGPHLAGATVGVLAAAILIALAFGAIITSHAGPHLVHVVRRWPSRRVASGALIFLVGIVVVQNGAWGFLVATALTPLGMLPHRWGVPRALLMGFLLVPYLGATHGAGLN